VPDAPVLECREVARREKGRIVGDRLDKRMSHCLSALLKSPSTWTMRHAFDLELADAEAHAVIVVADMGIDRAMPYLPALPPPVLTLSLAGGRSISSCSTTTSSGVRL